MVATYCARTTSVAQVHSWSYFFFRISSSDLHLNTNRNNHTTALINNQKIYIHGGHDGAGWLDDLHILDIEHHCWQPRPNVSGHCPSARACHSMTRVGRRLFMFGGYDGSKCFNDLDVMDIDTTIWLQVLLSQHDYYFVFC